MTKPATSALTFTKLVVDDLEKLTKFYIDAYGLQQIQRVQASIGDDPIDETILGSADGESGVLILMKYVDKAPPTKGEVVLGFRTDDIEALFERIRASGGGVYLDIKHDEGSPYKAGFATDPEGHLAEVLQFLEA